jgi:hypothetical protein
MKTCGQNNHANGLKEMFLWISDFFEIVDLFI